MWEKWFAWYPVKIRDNWCWMRIIYRKQVMQSWQLYPDLPVYNYGTIIDVIGDE